MTNTVKCQDCPATMTRGHAHVRSVSLEQVFYCPACWSFREQVAGLVRSVSDADVRVGGTLGERLARVYAEHEASA
jgi:hypothetical protein